MPKAILPAVIPRPAATLVLLRPGRPDPEVLMLQRTQTAAFLGGAYVFPGGSLDPADADARIGRRVFGLSDDQANARLKLEYGALAYYAAAVRECFEEAGILLLCDAAGKLIGAEQAASLMHRRADAFADLLEEEQLYIPAHALAYFGHWITPAGRTRRFDARFFVALAPDAQAGSHDRNETVHHQWISAREALERYRRKEIELVDVTRHILTDLARFADARAAYEWASELKEIDTNRGCRAQGGEGMRYFRRADPQYFEIHWSDPEETGETTYDLVPGVPKRLDRYVTRLTAPNPGMMAGPGSNTYLVGEDELAVIDPGPNLGAHIAKILEFRNIRWIFCTQTHMDHSPAAAAIKAATGAQVLGRPARVAIGGVHLRAIQTAGHASNPVCYLLEETKMLFTGDHAMYLGSFERLLAEEVAIFAPGHGYLIGEPHKELRLGH
jgi:8-oxo-dGTP pyrophosphatase MutT (NUDIX family)